jgi:hypothetical protein
VDVACDFQPAVIEEGSEDALARMRIARVPTLRADAGGFVEPVRGPPKAGLRCFQQEMVVTNDKTLNPTRFDPIPISP